MTVDRAKLSAEIQLMLDPYRDLLEGAQDDVQVFLERAATAIASAIAARDRETAEEVAGGMRALAFSTRVELSRANARLFRRTVLLIARAAVAALAAV